MSENPAEMRRQLRQSLRLKRRNLSMETAREKSRQIQTHLLESRLFREAHCIFSYVAAVDREVETRLLLEAGLAEGKLVYVPFLEGAGLPMQAGRLQSLEDLKSGLWGIPQAPKPSRESPRFDCILVPGVGFDRQGSRLGLGGGYFDRWLHQRPGTRIGLAYAFQVVPEIPVESWDEPVHWLVTENGLEPARPLNK